MTLTRAEKIHHIGYEATMLTVLLCTGIPKADVTMTTDAGQESLSASYMKNLIIEGRAMHARNVIEFFTRNNEIKLKDIFPGMNLSVHDHENLESLHKLVSRQIVHMTNSRVADVQGALAPVGKDWPLSLFNPLLSVIKTFVDKVLANSPMVAEMSPDTDEMYRKVSARLPLNLSGPTPVPTGYYMGLNGTSDAPSVSSITISVNGITRF